MERWFDIWNILFPDTPRPVSPYVGDEVGEIIPVRSLTSLSFLLVLTNWLDVRTHSHHLRS
jgi:hypothetical protein